MAAAPGLLPREHGAYAQLGVALAAALALAPSRPGACQALLTVALFLFSEPALILIGQRGEALRATLGRAARSRCLALAGLGALGALGAWPGSPSRFALALLPAALLGVVLFGLFLVRRERTGAGEVVAAWAFSAATLPVTLLGHGGPRRAALLALFLAALFTVATAIVHGHLIALRRGVALPRLAAFLFGCMVCLAAAWAGIRLVVGLLPMTLAALLIWLRPPAPRHLKRVGWAAAACALAGALLAVLALH
jgi:hypothetical protein